MKRWWAWSSEGDCATRVGQRHVLRVVVAQHQVADLVGHLGEDLVALLDRHVAVGDQPR